MMAKDNKLKILVVSLIIVLVLITGFSFGYYLLNRFQENGNVAGSKCFKLELSNEKNAITLDNMYPISDEEGKRLTPFSFTITNTCDMLASYTVNMEMLEGTTLNSKYLDVMVNNEEIKLLTSYESTDTVITGSTESRILAKGTLAYNDSTDYTVRFWMDKDVEDVESMNKYFASKIVVVATPSTWNPKDAGYDTLHDAILANEYQTTPEIAEEKITAKGTPDLSQTAPIIKWIEKTGESTTSQVIKPTLEAINSITELSDLNNNEQYMYICTTKNFDSETGKYFFSDCSLKDPTTLDYSGNIKYYYSAESMSYNQTISKLYVSRNTGGDTRAFQILGASKMISTQITDGISYLANVYNLSCVILDGLELETDKSDKGLYKGIDDYGTTYYYRGNVKNNNVYFAGFYWQIVRINGDGSIRLMYNGLEKSATGVKQSINNKTYKFNSKYNDPAYVGYMYGNPDGTTFDEVHNNTNSSSIKINIDSWYKTNIVDKGYSNYVSNTIGFCGDRSIYDGGDGIQTDKSTNFGAYGRKEENTAQFTCPNIERDLYTTSDAIIGNKSLTYPVGLITYDELVYAGMDQRHTNKLSWTYSTQNYWTMSPAFFLVSSGYAGEWREYSAGYIHPWIYVTSSNGARPVINLKSDVKISGGIGTYNDPFTIE